MSLTQNRIRERLGTKRMSRNDREPFGTIYPNGEFSLSWPKQRRTETTERVEQGERIFKAKQPLVSPDCLASLCNEIHTSEDELWFFPPPKRKNGLRGITREGKKFVRSAAALLQRKYTRFRLSFLTLTLPELPIGEARVIAMNWGRVINRYIQWLRRTLSALGLPKLIVGCSEVQPSRFESGSPSHLHAHLVFRGRLSSRGTWPIEPHDFRLAWLRILSNELGRPVYSDSCEEVRMVRKSGEAYLGKYMSKGSEDAQAMATEFGEDFVPGQWWFCTAEMRAWVKSETLRGPSTGQFLEALVNFLCCFGWDEMGVWAMPCHIDLDGQQFLVAWVGRLPPNWDFPLDILMLN